MLCSHGFQSTRNPFMVSYWPVRSQWPDVKPLFQQQYLLQEKPQELCSSLQLMDKLQREILEVMQPFRTGEIMKSVSYQPEKEGEHFGLTLNTQGFSPEELSVRQVGRKLRISGKTEKKQEDEECSYSYRRQEFRQEFDLPEGLNPEGLTCFLASDGKLHIQGAEALCDEHELLALKMSLEENTQQSVCSDGSSTHTDGNTQDKPENLD